MARQKKEWPDKDETTEIQYVTVSMIARRINQSRSFVRDAIEGGKILGVKAPSNYNSSGFEWNVRLEDAEAYIAQRQSDGLLAAAFVEQESGISEKLEPVENETVGTPDCCGSCGRDTGNILGDVDDRTQRQYGYLCYKCYKLVHLFHSDTQRMEKVLTYLEKTRRPVTPLT